MKAVIIGFSHMHVNEIASYITDNKSVTLVAVADVPSTVETIPTLRYTPEWNKQNVTHNYCSNYYESYTEMLDKEKPDIAYILTENCQKPEVVLECAKRGINVSIEKPLAVNLEEAKKIQEAVKKYGIKAVVNWPVMWREHTIKMKMAIDSKVVGEPIKLRYINGHTGPLGKGARHRGVSANAEEMTDEMRSKTWWHQESHGGGVLLDISCYGCWFTRYYLGKGAKSVMSMAGNLNTPFGDTADNFGAAIRYDDKLSFIEGTWTTPRKLIPSGPMVICTDGVIVSTGGALEKAEIKAFDLLGNEVEIPDYKLEEKFNNMPCQLEQGFDNVAEMLTLDANMDVMAILDAVIKSTKSGKEEKISD